MALQPQMASMIAILLACSELQGDRRWSRNCPVAHGIRPAGPAAGDRTGMLGVLGSQGGFQDRERTRKSARPRASQPQAHTAARSLQPAVLTSWRRRVSQIGFGSQAVDVGDGFHRESEGREGLLSSSTITFPTDAHCTTRHEIETIGFCICMRRLAAPA